MFSESLREVKGRGDFRVPLGYFSLKDLGFRRLNSKTSSGEGMLFASAFSSKTCFKKQTKKTAYFFRRQGKPFFFFYVQTSLRHHFPVRIIFMRF